MNDDTVCSTRSPARRWLSVVLCAALVAATGTHAASAADAFAPDRNGEPVLLDANSLEAVASPVALYPDELLAIVLPAATYPLQIVQAARFLEARKTDTSLEPDDDWDDSIIALLNYPEVVDLLNSDLDWTWRLGEAVLNQQPELMQAISRFRERAFAAGNLQTDDRQQIVRNNGVIEIVPVQPEVVYVPYYEPTQVIYARRRPLYYYYPDPHPLYYYPYPSNYGFGSSTFWGITTAFTIGWSTNRLYLHDHSYSSHPYHKRSYHRPYYRHYQGHGSRRNTPREARRDRHYRGDDWQAGRNSGQRPHRTSNWHKRSNVSSFSDNRSPRTGAPRTAFRTRQPSPQQSPSVDAAARMRDAERRDTANTGERRVTRPAPGPSLDADARSRNAAAGVRSNPAPLSQRRSDPDRGARRDRGERGVASTEAPSAAHPMRQPPPAAGSTPRADNGALGNGGSRQVWGATPAYSGNSRARDTAQPLNRTFLGNRNRGSERAGGERSGGRSQGQGPTRDRGNGTGSSRMRW